MSHKELLNAPLGRRGNRARWLTVWWLRWRDRMTGGQVARRLGVSRARVCQLAARARADEEAVGTLAMWMQQLRELEHRSG